MDRQHVQIVIVGAGAGGIATAASLLARDKSLEIALIDPVDVHHYQPGWTMVGGGVFDLGATRKPMTAVLPRGVQRIRAAVTRFDPDANCLTVDGGAHIGYERLVVCPGLALRWDAVEGLEASLGRNGVTSNYLGDLAPYTWELVRGLRRGRALFTQPPMPIKCAGAPQKAMYLAADHWRRSGVLENIDVQLCSAGAVLFGVLEYVPALMRYIDRYGIDLRFGQTLCAIDGARQLATFAGVGPDGRARTVERAFDMIHVVPPQGPPAFIGASALADRSGWLDVDAQSLQHKRYDNVFGLGDVINTSNAKTAAAVRKQAPVVAHNLLASLGRADGKAFYDGYGSCPLTVERGRVVLAEFGYGGQLAPTFPAWLLDGRQPSRLAWMLKANVLPALYWHGMLKGREWLTDTKMA
jgi:sulfide:quinone oxidoreductase